MQAGVLLPRDPVIVPYKDQNSAQYPHVDLCTLSRYMGKSTAL
jgi:hypothetical protein